ncbi:hypothetical protein Cpir12675_006086 [Ceratocystis pirilliformis]|uniref:GDP/GTP exchange factor Sec2 N-terminal domain-containing protein n=1 Tax=Ceratocystis pirilliformis TaxID=259994 RepID=A0ABR3YL97_9PEZI
MAASPTLAAAPVLLPLPLPASATCCPSCGAKLEHHIDISAASEAQVALIEAQRRIAELENRVRNLQNQLDRTSINSGSLPDSPPHSPYFHQQKLSTSTSSSASTRNYTHQKQGSNDYLLTPPSSASAPRYVAEPPSTPSQSRPTTSSSSSWGFSASRFASLLSRKSTPNIRVAANSFSSTSSSQPPPSPPPSSTGVNDLMAALNREQNLRAKAEGRLVATSKEVEELSVVLFEQANEMVASERRARAKLEQRVAVLERRDADKKARLQSLEGAMDQIQRVKILLNTEEAAPPPASAAA